MNAEEYDEETGEWKPIELWRVEFWSTLYETWIATLHSPFFSRGAAIADSNRQVRCFDRPRFRVRPAP